MNKRTKKLIVHRTVVRGVTILEAVVVVIMVKVEGLVSSSQHSGGESTGIMVHSEVKAVLLQTTFVGAFRWDFVTSFSMQSSIN